MARSMLRGLLAAALVSLTVAHPALAKRHAVDVAKCLSDTTGGMLANNVQFIAYGYSPVSASGPPQTGGTLSAVSSTAVSQMLTTIAAAFKIAPTSFQNILCNLDGIFIDPNPYNGSWGYRDASTFNNRYVAINMSIFQTNGVAINFDVYSTWRLNTILGLTYNYSSSYWPFYFMPAQSKAGITNDATITMLAALAHEVGHIYWYDANKPNGIYDYSFCNNKFLTSWDPKNMSAPDPWTGLGDREGEHTDDPSSDNVFVSDINQSLGNYQKIENIITKLYDPQKSRWATVLAAFSPDEDFVETFQNVILTYPGTSYALTSQILKDSSNNVIGDTFKDKGKFISKKHCFSGL